jgi:hypothetical protein
MLKKEFTDLENLILGRIDECFENFKNAECKNEEQDALNDLVVFKNHLSAIREASELVEAYGFFVDSSQF